MAAASILSRRLTVKFRFSPLNTLISNNHNSVSNIPKTSPQIVTNFSTFENKFSNFRNPNLFSFEKIRTFSTHGDDSNTNKNTGDHESINSNTSLETEKDVKPLVKDTREEIEAMLKTMELTRKSLFTASMINAGVAMWCFKTLDIDTMYLLLGWSVGFPVLSAMGLQKYLRRMDRCNNMNDQSKFGMVTDSLQVMKNFNKIFRDLRLNAQAFYPIIAMFTVYKVYSGGS